jgi:uncharacterized Zn-binding protein involved in type VI secretion
MPAVARQGDSGVAHCSGYTIAGGSPDVFINGRPAARVGDSSTVHLRPGSPCVPHTASISQGSGTVNVNGRPLARVGDALAGCTTIAQGSPTVSAG